MVQLTPTSSVVVSGTDTLAHSARAGIANFFFVFFCARHGASLAKKTLFFFGRVLRETHVRFHTRLRARLLAHNPTLAHTRDTPRSSASLQGENHDPPPPRPCPRAPTCTRAHKHDVFDQ
jgi:hypothetical protein